MDLFKDYRISSPYGGRLDPLGERGEEFHRGIDLVKPFQSPVYAFVSGEVLHASLGQPGTGFGDYGNVVAIRDKNGYLHCYCHLDMCVVKVGQKVDQGQMIGRLGNTGRSTGPHLHYEVRMTCTPSFGWHKDVDPTVYLQKYYKEEDPVLEKSDANKIIEILGYQWQIANLINDEKGKAEFHRLANTVKVASGQKVTD